MTGAKNDLKDDENHTNVVATRRGIIVGAVVLLGLHVITAPVKLGLVMSAKRVAFFFQYRTYHARKIIIHIRTEELKKLLILDQA